MRRSQWPGALLRKPRTPQGEKGFPARVPRRAKPIRGSIEKPGADVLGSVFIATDTTDPLPTQLVRTSARLPGLATATVRLSDLPKIAGDSRVLSAPGQGLANPNPVVSAATVVAPTASLSRFGSAAKSVFFLSRCQSNLTSVSVIFLSQLSVESETLVIDCNPLCVRQRADDATMPPYSFLDW